MSEQQAVVPVTLRRGAIAVAIGLGAGLLFVLGPYVIYTIVARGGIFGGPVTSVVGFNGSLTLLFPLVQGMAMAFALGRERRSFSATLTLSAILTIVTLFASAVLMAEGIICLIILSPLLFVMIWGGALLGRLIVQSAARKAVQVSLAPLIVLAVLGEARGPAPEFSAAVADSIVVDAPPEYVWRYVVSYPENQSPSEYWLWRVGLPKPIQSVAEAPRVGATRQCVFDGGLAFEERITELEPNRVMTFDVTRQPDHPEVIGHFQFDRGQILLTPMPTARRQSPRRAGIASLYVLPSTSIGGPRTSRARSTSVCSTTSAPSRRPTTNAINRRRKAPKQGESASTDAAQSLHCHA